MVEYIFRKWRGDGEGIRIEETKRYLEDNIELLEMFNKDPNKIEQELLEIIGNKNTLVTTEKLFKYLKKDNDWTRKTKDY